MIVKNLQETFNHSELDSEERENDNKINFCLGKNSSTLFIWSQMQKFYKFLVIYALKIKWKVIQVQI